MKFIGSKTRRRLVLGDHRNQGNVWAPRPNSLPWKFATALLTAFLLIGAFPSAAFAQSDNKPSLADELPRIPAKEPKEALATFEVQKGFRLDLIASEPVVNDPTASVYDENGRMYVVQMRGYPYQKYLKKPPIGQIRILEDPGGDGVFEKSTIFVDEISWPTGIACWKGGVFVGAAPDIWYFKDTDGDRKADVREKIFTGFGTHNVQGLMNNLKWGLDNKIYGASSSTGGEVRSLKDPNAPALSMRGRDFRFDPRTLRLEQISGTAQFGNGFDDWGNRFVCSNSDHARHVVLPARYLKRNPYSATPRVINSIAKEGGAAPVYRKSSAEPWRIVRTRRRAASGKKYAPTELFPIGFFTSASGITVYRGGAYPSEFQGNLFIGDVGGNLVHRKTLTPSGASFVAVRADQKTEFIRSTDNWFRPVNFTNAPDGTLNILDMYRETIEHPYSIPEDIKSHLDLESGRNRGRIYRLTPPGFDPAKPPRLGSASTPELVDFLSHPNAWQRETAQRLLYERQDPAATDLLRRALRESEPPKGRLHALWTLKGLDGLTAADVLVGLNDASPRVREHAVRLAEPFLDENQAVRDRVLNLVADKDDRVRFQVAFSLGESSHADVNGGLLALVRSDGADVWFRTAILSSAADRAGTLLEDLTRDKEFARSSAGQSWLQELANIVGSNPQEDELTRVVQLASSKSPTVVQLSVVSGLGRGLRRSRKRLDLLSDLKTTLEATRNAAANDGAGMTERLLAIDVLGHTSFAFAGETLSELLSARQPQTVQLAAVSALGRFSDVQVADALLAAWKASTPPVRSETVQTLLSRSSWLFPFLDAIESRKVAAGQVPQTRQTVLLNHRDAKIKQRAREVFGKQQTTPRGAIVEQFKPALKLEPDLARGRKIFERECMTCHKVGGKGHEVGPDLATVRNRTPDGVMTHVLDPNREVLPNYLEYLIELDDGRLVTGLIASESATSITLKRAEGKQDVILRSAIEQITSSGKSLMPEGMEKKITPQDMADLIGYVLQIK